MGKELIDNIPSKVGDLLNDVKNGKVGLPDLQRTFVCGTIPGFSYRCSDILRFLVPSPGDVVLSSLL